VLRRHKIFRILCMVLMGASWLTMGEFVNVANASGTVRLVEPLDVVFGGGHVWVADNGNVLELNASNGSLVRTIGNFSVADALAYGDGAVWVATWHSGPNDKSSLVEINSATGAIERTISGASYHFDSPISVAVSGKDVWVDSEFGESVHDETLTELSAENGNLMRVLTVEGDAEPDTPNAIAANDRDLWVAGTLWNAENQFDFQGAVTEIDSSTGKTLRVIDDNLEGTATPEALVVDGPRVWIASQDFSDSGSVSEISTESGAIVNGPIDNQSDPFSNPIAICASATTVWVSNSPLGGGSGYLSAFPSSSGVVTTAASLGVGTFGSPAGIACAGGDVWAADSSGQIVELNGSSGHVIRIIR
jgi:hypothetical protein